MLDAVPCLMMGRSRKAGSALTNRASHRMPADGYDGRHTAAEVGRLSPKPKRLSVRSIGNGRGSTIRTAHTSHPRHRSSRRAPHDRARLECLLLALTEQATDIFARPRP